jgi:hypothetical protein
LGPEGIEVDVIDLETGRPLNEFGYVSSHVSSSLPTVVVDRGLPANFSRQSIDTIAAHPHRAGD